MEFNNENFNNQNILFMKTILILLLLIFSLDFNIAYSQSKNEAYIRLPFGSVKPSGWIKEQMEKDMNGFVGNLDRLVPELINDPIYSTERLDKNSKAKELGNLKEGDMEGDDQYKWWNSETQSNWWDGYIRHALLLDNDANKKRVADQIKIMLATQDKNGYLGIYSPDMRYKFKSENGEFWSKTTLYRYLLAYYEYTKDAETWVALIKAVDDVMRNYPIGKSDPFNVGTAFSGGVAHGLTFTDVLDRMYQLTGDNKYQEYALFLYNNISDNYSSEEDIQLKNVLNPDYRLRCHAVHTFEHFRPLIVASFASKELRSANALNEYLVKVRKVTTKSGGAIGDEWIAERFADATHTGYEYCSLHELMDSYTLLMQKRGDQGLGDLIENVFYNAAMGARHPEKSCIAYLKTDNSYEMMGSKNGQKEDYQQTRYKYSPVHQDVAVCCVPNAGRITPYFLQSAWMKEGENTLVANLLVPSVLETEINWQKVKIENVTAYPYNNSFTLNISTQNAVPMKLKIRKPSWVTSVKSNTKYTECGEHLVFEGIFSGNETIHVSFETNVRVIRSDKDEHYFAYGALIFARPIAAKEIEGRKYAEGFVDLMYKSLDDRKYEFIADHKATYDNGEISVNLKNKKTNKVESVKLVPLSKTILRQVSFL